MKTFPELITTEFRTLSARLGKDSLQVQGPGGNTSIKNDQVMWIKASGTELADALDQDIFVPVDRRAAVEEAYERAGDGSCKTTVIDPAIALRPSIETTFHAALDQAVVAHSHSVAVLTHVISPQGREACAKKLAGLPFVMVPYAKPGLPLTKEILARINDDTRIIILHNHGVIACGDTVEEVANHLARVEQRLSMPARLPKPAPSTQRPDLPAGYEWSEFSALALDARASVQAVSGTYYPDHVVFLGPKLPTAPSDQWPVYLVEGCGVAIKSDATSSQRALLKCLADVLARLPADWSLDPIGEEAEASLLNWDAEKYRQALAKAKK